MRPVDGGKEGLPLVLLLDDDPDVVAALGRLLSTLGPALRVQAETDPEVALDKLDGEKPDVIVADYRMPGMDGLTFLKRAKGKAPDARRIMLTGQQNRFVVEAGIMDQFMVLSKPVEPSLFVTIVARLSRIGQQGKAPSSHLPAASGSAGVGEMERRTP